MLKLLLYLLMSVCFFSCNYPGKGSLGGWASITFPVPKDKLKLAIDSLRNTNPENEIPERWRYDSEYWERDSGGIKEPEVLYIKKQPEEMYYFSYIPMEDNQSNTSTTVALRSVFRNGTWYRKAVLDTTEQRRISRRFYEEIIAKLELITNTKSRSENEEYEQSKIVHGDSDTKSDFILTIDSNKNIRTKTELSIKEKADSIASKLIQGKFEISSVHELEKVCASSGGLTMQSFTTTVEELFYSNMASFINYYIANPSSCLKEKLKQSMEVYMAAYEPKDRRRKNIEKENRILKKAERENLSPNQFSFLYALFKSINLQ